VEEEQTEGVDVKKRKENQLEYFKLRIYDYERMVRQEQKWTPAVFITSSNPIIDLIFKLGWFPSETKHIGVIAVV